MPTLLQPFCEKSVIQHFCFLPINLFCEVYLCIKKSIIFILIVKDDDWDRKQKRHKAKVSFCQQRSVTAVTFIRSTDDSDICFMWEHARTHTHSSFLWTVVSSYRCYGEQMRHKVGATVKIHTFFSSDPVHFKRPWANNLCKHFYVCSNMRKWSKDSVCPASVNILDTYV